MTKSALVFKGFVPLGGQIRSCERNRSKEASACLKHYIEAKCGEGQCGGDGKSIPKTKK